MLPGFDYLLNTRHINQEMIDAFHLAYCDTTGSIYGDSFYATADLHLDPRFRNTALFPIFDVYNTLIGVSARTLEKNTDHVLKYVNTIYPKTKHLYGLNIALPYCIETKTAYIVEGNVDTIMMHQAGIKNAVGMLGSALREAQLILLSRFVNKIIVMPDGDRAGWKLLKKVQDIVPKMKLDLEFTTVRLPDGYDPDKFLLQFGPEKLIQLETELFPTLDQRLSQL